MTTTDDFGESGKDTVDDSEFEPIPVNNERTVVTGIEGSFGSATKKVEEIIDNSKDAHANNVEFVASLKHNLVANKDDGIGNKDSRDPPQPGYLKVVTWASPNKEQDEKVEDNPDVNGLFGEGGKSMLGISDRMIYHSNNGSDKDHFIELRRVPKLPLQLRRVEFAHREPPKGTLKPELGTIVYCHGVSDDNILDIQKHIKESAGTKFAWLIAEGFRINAKFLDKEGNTAEQYDIPIVSRLMPLFEDYPAKKRLIGSLFDSNKERDITIEAIALPNVRQNQRKIIYCRKKRIIKEVPIRNDVMIIVNFDSTKILKDRRSFDRNDPLTKQYLDMVDEFVNLNHPEPSSPFEAMNDRQKEEQLRLDQLLNRLVEKSKVFQKFKKANGEQPTRAEVPEDQQNVTNYLKTTRKELPAVLKPETELLSKIHKTPPNPPRIRTPTKTTTTTTTPKVKKIKSTLVTRLKTRYGKQYHGIGVNIQTNKRDKYESYFDFTSREFEDQEEEVGFEVVTEKNKITVWLNEKFNFFKSKKPKSFPKPKFEPREMLPLISQAVAQALHADENLPAIEYQKKVDEILHYLSQLYVDPKADGRKESKPVDEGASNKANGAENESKTDEQKESEPEKETVDSEAKNDGGE